MELQHRQQSQDHKGRCTHNLSLTLLYSYFSLSLCAHNLLLPHMHAHTHAVRHRRRVTHFHLHRVRSLSSLLLLPLLLVSIPSSFSFSPHIILFLTQFLSSLSSPPHLGSNIKHSLKKNKANRNKANKTHTQREGKRENTTIPFTPTCPASLRLTGMPSDSMQKQLATLDPLEW